MSPKNLKSVNVNVSGKHFCGAVMSEDAEALETCISYEVQLHQHRMSLMNGLLVLMHAVEALERAITRACFPSAVNVETTFLCQSLSVMKT